ncbi:MAG: phosphatidylglycerophosphatase A [Comamonadaceae bacterium]|nr:MAG: phosphatidylglycerophosphatase A [Comamonadaceae bacterium]
MTPFPDSPDVSMDGGAPAPLNPSVRPPVRRPSLKFMLVHPAHIIALGFGSGLSRLAPGTAGTLWAWAAYVVLARWLDTAQMGWLIAASLPIGWWACTVTANHMRVMDPGNIVWDEVAAFWIVLWLVMPTGFWGQIAAFALFRFFDAVKPGPVAWADELFHGFNARGGFGIMFDDLVAAFCTLLVIAFWRFA